MSIADTQVITRELSKISESVAGNREANIEVKAQLKRIEDVQLESLKEQRKTNGRVTELEKKHIAAEAIHKTREDMTKDVRRLIWSVATAAVTAVVLGVGGVLFTLFKMLP